MRLITILTILSFSISIMSAQVITWEGNQSNDWHEPLNWSTKEVPTASSEVIIDNGQVQVISNAVAKTILLDNTSTLDIDDNAVLTLVATTPFSNKIDINGNSTFIITKGKVQVESADITGVTINDGTLVNRGFIHCQEAAATGIIVAVAGILLNEDSITIENTGQNAITNSGTIENQNGASINLEKGGNMLSLVGGIINIGGSTMTNDGSLSIDSTQGISLLNRGQFENQGSISITNAATAIQNEDKLINDGAILLDKSSDIAFINQDTLENNNLLAINECIGTTSFQNQGVLINEDSISINAGISEGFANQKELINKAMGRMNIISTTQAISNNSIVTNQGLLRCNGGTGSGIFNDSLVTNLGGDIIISFSSQGIVNNSEDSIAHFGTLELIAVSTGISNRGNFNGSGQINYYYPDTATLSSNAIGILNEPGAHLTTRSLTIKSFSGRGIWNLGTYKSIGRVNIFDFKGDSGNIGVLNIGDMEIADDQLFSIFGEENIPTIGIISSGVLDIIGILNLTQGLTQSLDVNAGRTTITPNGLLVINPFGEESLKVDSGAIFEVLGQICITDEITGF